MTVMSCIERVSTIDTLLPVAYESKPVGLRSDEPPLLRDGGPGSIMSHDSLGDRSIDMLVCDLGMDE